MYSFHGRFVLSLIYNYYCVSIIPDCFSLHYGTNHFNWKNDFVAGRHERVMFPFRTERNVFLLALMSMNKL